MSAINGRLRVALTLVLGSPPRRDAVARFGVALGHVELRLVGDVADHAGLGAAAEQRALRTFEHLDALHVDHVDVEVARRELHRLVVEIDRDVRERGEGRGRLVAGRSRRSGRA